ADLGRGVSERVGAQAVVVRGWSGVTSQSVTPGLARSLGRAAAEGALVVDVTAGGPAAKAGIARGDVIERWGEHAIRHSRELPLLVAGTAPGTRVAVTLVRDGRQRTVDVTVAKMPPQPPRQGRTAPSPRGAEAWGLSVETLGPRDARRLGLEPGSGVRVVDVEDGSPADEAELEPDDVIVEANRRPVRSPADLGRALAASPGRAPLRVRRRSAPRFAEMP